MHGDRELVVRRHIVTITVTVYLGKAYFES
jgi:hypothetical protein